MKEILEQYSTALNNKQTIINKLTHKQKPYYYTVMVEVKHRTSFLGFNGEPEYTEEPEVRFNEKLLSEHLVNADAIIDFHQKRIDQALPTLQKELINSTKEKDHQLQIVESLKNQSNNYQNQYNQTRQEINVLTEKLAPWQEQEAKLDNKINQTTSRIESLNHVTEVSSNPVSDIEPIMRSLSDQQRAFFLMDAWGKEDLDSKETIAAIKSIGFDPTYPSSDDRTLVHLAAERNDLGLLDLIVTKKPSSIEGQTLLQYCAIYSTQDFIAKFLDYRTDYSYGLLFIISENDNPSLQKLLNIKSELVKLINHTSVYNIFKNKQFETAAILIKHGIETDETLGIAIEKNAHDIVNFCFKLDPELINKTKLPIPTLSKYAKESDNLELTMLIKDYTTKNTINSLNVPVFDQNYEQTNLLGKDYDSNEALSDY